MSGTIPVKVVQGALIYNLSVKLTETLADFKHKVFLQSKVYPCQQMLIFFGDELNDDQKRLDDYCIRANSEIILTPRLGEKIDFVITDGDKNYQMKVPLAATIRQLKESIHMKDSTRIPGVIKLNSSNESDLKDNAVIADCDFRGDYTLVISFQVTGGRRNQEK